MSKQLTDEEVRGRFLRAVNQSIDSLADSPETRDKLQRLAFDIMCIIDGAVMGIPGFMLVPTSTEEDKQFYIERGEDYFPVNDTSKAVCDIGGELHDVIGEYR